LPIQVQEASRIPNRLDQTRTSPWHIIIKTTSMENRERILKAVREKKQITYKRIYQNNRFLNGNLGSILSTEISALGYSTKRNYNSKLTEQ
jgi:hypothetical protein